MLFRSQEKIHQIGPFVPTFMVPYVRHAYWRWWRLPDPSGTRHSSDLFLPFDSATGGLFWYDAAMHEETKEAMKRGRPLEPVTIVDKTYMMPFLK